MSDPFTEQCVYCGSPDVMDDAWWCPKRECWAAYEHECAIEMWRETHRPLTSNKARKDLTKTGANVWGHAYGDMVRAIDRLVVWA